MSEVMLFLISAQTCVIGMFIFMTSAPEEEDALFQDAGNLYFPSISNRKITRANWFPKLEVQLLTEDPQVSGQVPPLVVPRTNVAVISRCLEDPSDPIF